MPKVHDLTGKHFGRLKILERNPKNDNHGGSRWDCECDCGNKITVQAGNLKNNHTQSCGCLNKEVTSKTNSAHGLTNTPEYYTWAAIKRRCYGTYSPDYPDYGGRGIVMCEEWKDDFTAFLRDMGPRPSSSHSIDRKNNDKGYDKENLAGAEYAKFDMTKSGALMSWEYFFPNTDPPLACLFVHDYDLHEWKYTNHTAAFEAWLRYDKVGQDWDRWYKLCNNREYLDEALLKGSVVVDLNESIIQSFINTPNNIVFNSFYSDEHLRKINYAIFNGMHFLRNEISTILYEKHDIDMVIGWSVRGKEVIFSVRAPKREHVPEHEKFSAKRFAESYGGGGHSNAASFPLPLEKGMELVKHLMSKT